jgi:hypothetical protein
VCHQARDKESAVQNFARLKKVFGGAGGIKRLQQEPVHLLFPLNVIPDLPE